MLRTNEGRPVPARYSATFAMLSGVPMRCRGRRDPMHSGNSSKPIGKTKIEEHNCIRGRGLLQKLPRNETGEVQRCEEMLAYGPTNLKVGLTPDEARAT